MGGGGGDGSAVCSMVDLTLNSPPPTSPSHLPSLYPPYPLPPLRILGQGRHARLGQHVSDHVPEPGGWVDKGEHGEFCPGNCVDRTPCRRQSSRLTWSDCKADVPLRHLRSRRPLSACPVHTQQPQRSCTAHGGEPDNHTGDGPGWFPHASSYCVDDLVLICAWIPSLHLCPCASPKYRLTCLTHTIGRSWI